jgi:hypothetical protein
MQATVIRSGQHSGGKHFVEVQETPSSPCYAVPVSDEVPLGTVLDITVKVAEPVKPVEPAPAGTDLTTSTEPEMVIEESPLAPNDTNPDTVPSGQAEPGKPAVRPERTKGEDEKGK